MNNLLNQLIKCYKEKDLELIYDITRLNVINLKPKLIEDLKKMTLDDIFFTITIFNFSLINKNYNKMPVYFFDDNWIILEIQNINENDLTQSIGKVIESSFFGIKTELNINDILDESKNGILNKGKCFIGKD